MRSKCAKIYDLNIDCARVANMSTCSGTITWENLLSTSGSPEYSCIRFMLFHIIMMDKMYSFVKKVSGTEMDIVHLTAAIELNLLKKII